MRRHEARDVRTRRSSVADDWQRRGIASQLMEVLTTAAAVAGIEVLEGLVLRENRGMLDLCRKLGFRPSGSSGDPAIVRVAKPLRQDDPPDSSPPAA